MLGLGSRELPLIVGLQRLGVRSLILLDRLLTLGFVVGILLGRGENILTPAQKDAYDEAKSRQMVQTNQAANTQALQANNQRQAASAQTEQAWAASVAEQQENERRRQLNQEAMYAAERSRAEQEAREYEQRRSTEEKWRRMEAQNSYHRPYNTPPPFRRIRPDNRTDSNNPPRP